MKLTILYLFLMLGIGKTKAQTFNPFLKPSLNAPQASNLRELRAMDKSRIDQENTEVMRQLSAIAPLP